MFDAVIGTVINIPSAGSPMGTFCKALLVPLGRSKCRPLFDAVCRMGLDVSKHRERIYRPGRCDHWVKIKNRKHPAYSRVADQFRGYCLIGLR